MFFERGEKILPEERINTNAGEKVIQEFLLVLAGPKGILRQEIVYLDRSVGDPNSYALGDKDSMLAEAKRILFRVG